MIPWVAGAIHGGIDHIGLQTAPEVGTIKVPANEHARNQPRAVRPTDIFSILSKITVLAVCTVVFLMWYLVRG